MILALKTDNPTAEFYLLDPTGQIVKEKVWPAGRELNKTLLGEIEKLIDSFDTLTGLIVFRGPGSFTGLRIGITVMNTIAYSQNIPIIGTKNQNWLKSGFQKLHQGKNDEVVLPLYSHPANITKSKK